MQARLVDAQLPPVSEESQAPVEASYASTVAMSEAIVFSPPSMYTQESVDAGQGALVPARL